MKEIHKIREAHYLKGKAISLKERIRHIEERAKKFLSSYGYKLVPTDHGTHRLVKMS